MTIASDDRALAHRLIEETLYGVNECDDQQCEACQEFYGDCSEAADSILAAFDDNRLTVIDLGEPVTTEELREMLRRRGDAA